MDERWQLVLIPAGFLIVFPLFWMAVCALVSLWGWRWLAQQYPQSRPFHGRTLTLRSGSVGWSRYNHVLNVGADGEGLWLSVMFLFRAGHPPLFIPWDQVTEARRGGVFVRHLELRFHRCSVRVRLQGRELEDYLGAAAGERLRLPTAS